MGEKLVATIGNGPAALLKAHGAVTVGADIVEAFVLAAYLEENAYRQYMAMQIGEPYVSQRIRAASVPREALVGESVQEEMGTLLFKVVGPKVRGKGQKAVKGQRSEAKG
jgi:ribulose-5-phosphate 4-epimerase/fuculose-1-phosphate aldolase